MCRMAVQTMIGTGVPKKWPVPALAVILAATRNHENIPAVSAISSAGRLARRDPLFFDHCDAGSIRHPHAGPGRCAGAFHVARVALDGADGRARVSDCGGGAGDVAESAN